MMTMEVIRHLTPKEFETRFPEACLSLTHAPILAEAKLRDLKLIVIYTKNLGGARHGCRDLHIALREK